MPLSLELLVALGSWAWAAATTGMTAGLMLRARGPCPTLRCMAWVHGALMRSASLRPSVNCRGVQAARTGLQPAASWLAAGLPLVYVLDYSCPAAAAPLLFFQKMHPDILYAWSRGQYAVGCRWCRCTALVR